jgi:hypothetical protein
MRRWLVTTVVVVSLAGAGTAGALVQDTVSKIHQGQWARLGSTPVYCQAITEVSTHAPAFDCNDWGPNHAVGGTYRGRVDQGGVTIDRWDAAGRNAREIATYRNR